MVVSCIGSTVAGRTTPGTVAARWGWTTVTMGGRPCALAVSASATRWRSLPSTPTPSRATAAMPRLTRIRRAPERGFAASVSGASGRYGTSFGSSSSSLTFSMIPSFPYETGCSRLLGPRRGAAEEAVDRGNEEEGGGGRDQEPTDDRAAQGGVLLPSLAEAERHGQHADQHRGRGHEHGAEASASRGERRRRRVQALAPLVVGEGHHEDGVGGGHPDRHDRAHQGGDAEGRLADEQHPDDAHQGAGEGGDDDEGTGPGLEVHDHDAVDEQGREDQPEPQPAEGGVHALHLAAQGDAAPRRELGRVLVHDPPDGPAD